MKRSDANQPVLIPPTIGEISRRKWEEFFARIERMALKKKRK